MVVIDRDVGGVIAELKALDGRFEVRLDRRQGVFHVFIREDSPDGGRADYLVRTIPAYQNSFGVWEGLDGRLVDRMRLINPHGTSGYDFARALQRDAERGQKEQRERFHQTTREHAAELQYALRKDLGEKPRVFVP